MARVDPVGARAMIPPGTWKKVSADTAKRVLNLLGRLGDPDRDLAGSGATWRLRVEGSVFTYYRTGTLVFNGGSGKLLEDIHAEVLKILQEDRGPIGKEVLIGLDESGKSESFGSLVLAAAVVPRDLLMRVEEIVASADTKEAHPTEYWDRIQERLSALRPAGLHWDLELCTPEEIDAENLNLVMDKGYERLLRKLPQLRDPGRCRVTLDDYGVHGPLTDYIVSLREAGAEVTVRQKADEDVIETRAASVLARWRRAEETRALAAEYSLPDAPLGSGGPSDPQTDRWLRAWKETGRAWPPVVRKKWKNVRELD